MKPTKDYVAIFAFRIDARAACLARRISPNSGQPLSQSRGCRPNPGRFRPVSASHRSILSDFGPTLPTRSAQTRDKFRPAVSNFGPTPTDSGPKSATLGRHRPTSTGRMLPNPTRHRTPLTKTGPEPTNAPPDLNSAEPAPESTRLRPDAAKFDSCLAGSDRHLPAIVQHWHRNGRSTWPYFADCSPDADH